MTTGTPPAGDPEEADVLAADRYLEAILAAGEPAADADDRAARPRPRDPARRRRRATGARPRPPVVPVRGAARGPARVDGRRVGRQRPASSSRSPPGVPPRRGADPLLPAILAGTLDPADDRVLDLDSRIAAARRPLLVGGAITSAALSLVGVAWVAWRATRQSPSTDVEAVQSVVGGLG